MRDNRSAYDSGIYDEHIVSVLPYYREFHNQAIDLYRKHRTPKSVIECIGYRKTLKIPGCNCRLTKFKVRLVVL